MKQAKIILSAMLVMAIVAGAFAFKISRGANTVYYTNTFLSDATVCTVPCTIPHYTTAIIGGGQTVVIHSASIKRVTTDCPSDLVLYRFD